MTSKTIGLIIGSPEWMEAKEQDMKRCLYHGVYYGEHCSQCSNQPPLYPFGMGLHQPYPTPVNYHMHCFCDEYVCKKCKKKHVRCCTCGEAKVII